MVLYKEITKERYVCERTSQNNEQQQQHQRTHIDSGMMVASNGSSVINGNAISGHMITLNIHVPHDNIIQPMQFDVQMLVGDVCRSIQGHLPITINHDPSEFGLFVNDVQHPSRSYWLDSSRPLNYYALKTGDNVDYRNKYRTLKIRLLDGTVRTILVDDSLIVAQLMVYICTKFGIANYDEYSIVYDLDADDASSVKTATLRRERSLQRTDKKMEELRKKCHTDDDTLWLDHSKTLRQQDIHEQSTVILRRKYFCSDTNIDQRDPVQLNLLYVQCRNGTIDGTHPVTYDEAIQFAGLQCQIQFGDYQESKHKPSILDVREFLPKEYTKTKGVEKRIFQQHKKYQGVSELDAKLKYTQLCRSLRTYGVTFFLVKEKMSGKNKLVPRLLGVTKESIVRVDERTKDFLEVWPLTHVKRWTASPNTFTLDFGDYATAYYSVQTHEGQQISQLIAGYIDIILKKKKDQDIARREGVADEEATLIEDIISPGKATIIQPNCPSFGYVHQQNVFSPPVMRGTYSDGSAHSQYQHYGPEYYPSQSYPMYPDQEQEEYFGSQIHEQPPLSTILHSGASGTVLYSSIENARNTVNSAQSQLAHELQMEYAQPPLSSLIDTQQEYSIEDRLDVSHQLLTSELSAINASTAQIVILTSDINTNQQTNRRNSDYNHSLGAAISTITNNLNEFCKEMDVYTNLINDQTNLMEQINRLCSIFNDLLTHIEALSDNNFDPSIRQNILLTASRLGEISQDLVRRLANEITTNYFDSSIEYQEKLLALAKLVANTTAAYVLKAKDIATNVQEQNTVNNIISTATQCALATSQLVACTKVVAATISSPLCQEQLIESARSVTRSIECVLQSCTPPLINDELYSKLTEAATTVRKSLNEFLLHIKLVTDSTAANSDGLYPSYTNGTKLIEADKLTNKTTTTTTITRRIIANDEIEEEDDELDEEILDIVKHHDQSIDKILTTSDRLFSSVGDAVEMVKQAKILAQATAQLVSSLRQQAELAGDDTNQQKKLLSAAKMLADATAKMVESAKGCAMKPNDTELQYQLKRAAEELRSATNIATNNINHVITVYVTSKATSEASIGRLECDNAIREMETSKTFLQQCALQPSNKYTYYEALDHVIDNSKRLGEAMTHIASASKNTNHQLFSQAVQDASKAVCSLAESSAQASYLIGISEATSTKGSSAIVDQPLFTRSVTIIRHACADLSNTNLDRKENVSESIKRLATSVKEMAPGQRECDHAIQELRTLYSEVDKAFTNVETLRKTDKSLQFHQEQISSTSHFISELTLDIRQSSKRDAERIGSYVTQFVTYIEPFVHHTIDYVSCMIHKREKCLILDQVKSIVETSLQLIMGTKESGGNIKNTQWHKVVDDNSELLTKSIHKLVHTLEEQSSSIGIMSGLSENIRTLISTLDTTMLPNQGHFSDYQTCMVEILRQMARTTQEILTQTSHTENIRHLANQLTREYNELINATYGAIGTAITNDLATRIKSVVADLGLTCIELIEKLGLYQQNNHDYNLKHTVENLCQKVIEKISYVLAALQTSARGTQACINAASTVSGIIADLDTTILFATAGTLNAEQDGETFADHREAILKTAKALVEDTKTLVAGAASSQEQLASAAQAAVRTITKLAEVVKLGAASLGADDGEAQVMLINSVKDVALALNNLINVTKSASGKNIDDPEMQKLKESAKIMVTNVTSLLRTVKSVEDEAQRGTNALEATIESIAQELRLFNNGQIPTNQTTPEELIRVTKQITMATAKAVAAGQSCRQDDIIAAANLGRKSVSDFLFVCKSSAYIADDKILQQRTLDSGRLCIKYYKELLETIHILIQKSSNETKQKLLNYSRMIAQSTQELVQCAKQLKGADFIDPDDPAYIAENELFNAAQSIEAAAKKLSALKPRRKPKEIDENLNFDEQILEAAKSITNAAGALISAATSAQKEIASQIKDITTMSTLAILSKSASDEDGQWSQGLISAARYVASACHVLCDAANGLVHGYGTEEKLISSAKQVSSNTAALLVACKVKADFMSQSMARLQTAGNAVKRAADALVRSAQRAVEMQQEDKYFEVSLRVVPGIAQEIKCKEAILTKERELDEARNRLKAIRLAKYGHSEQDSNEST
ncbi:unnamed protein product [Rotaria magnacalcarata]|uniref:Talin n=1 Tax=Rotaria magnacalcarata TaxID=392030 RepID=A0A814ZEF1_9BILA|nr:unnamed protein product [Rotaria magnacalcarata]